MKLLLRALLFTFLIGFVVPAFAAERVQCGSVNSHFMAGPVGYCAMLPPSYDSQTAKKFPVVYFLHGIGGDQSFLVSSGAWQLIEDMWEQKKLGEFVVITPQAYNSFYINSKDGRVHYDDFFIRDFIPQMEKKFRLTGTRSGRAISGISMGGYGALRFAFKYPQMFVSVAADMPALLEQLPRGAGNAGFNTYFGSAFGTPADEAFWKANSPFVYARSKNLMGLKIYADCGSNDDYGFEAGTRQLDQLLTARHIPHTINIYSGRHEWQFVVEHLPAALQFQSKALGLK